MKWLSVLCRVIAHRVSCAVEVVGWMFWGAWICSAEESLDAAGYEGGTR